MKKKLIIINQQQFGYNNATYYYCKYLKDDFATVYICWDEGLPKIGMQGVRVVYVSRKGDILIRTIRFLRTALEQINDRRAIVFIKYFKGVSLVLRLLRPRHSFVLDIRTGSVNKKPLVRKLQDMRLKFENMFFRHVTVISQSLAEKLGINSKAHILQLGADVISSKDKTFNHLHLLYVGSLFNRNMDRTIHGFKKFYDEFKDKIPISYTIVGDGPNNEVQYLQNITSRYKISEIVENTGPIPHDELGPYFDGCNIGVSYVPLTEYYDCQPVTKTFEYLLSGMPVIATNTSENRRVLTPQSGILVGDTADDFYSGMKAIFENRDLFDSAKIRNNAREYNWANIVQNNLKVFLEGIHPKKQIDDKLNHETRHLR